MVMNCMNDDNDLNLHSMTKLSGWLSYWLNIVLLVHRIYGSTDLNQNFNCMCFVFHELLFQMIYLFNNFVTIPGGAKKVALFG